MNTWHQHTFTLSTEGIWIINHHLNTLMTNPSLAKMLRVPNDERENVDPYHYIPEEVNERFYYDLKNWEFDPDPETIYQIKLKSGIRIWIEATIKTVQLNAQESGRICFFKDITKAKKLEKNQLENLRMYFSLFEDSPIPIWDEDFSELKKWIDQKKEEGIHDFETYLTQNPAEIETAAGKMIINKINKAVVKLNEGKSKEDVFKNLKNLRTKDFSIIIINQINSIAKGDLSCEFDAVLRTIKGNIRHVLFKWTVVKGFESTYGRIYLTTTDLTNRIVEDNIRLQQTNRDKEVLLREIHHRVKNNFQIITSLIRLQSGAINDTKMDSAMAILLNRIYSMAAVHELLYRSEKSEIIELDEYLNYLAQLLIESLHIKAQIEFEILSDNVAITLDQASPFGLILNELITNSVKHGFKELTHGRLYIHASEDGAFIRIEIGDNGSGKISNTEHSDSLGLALVDSLVEQLNASIEQINKQPGVHYILKIPNIAGLSE